MKKTDIARVAHEVNKAYCEALGDNSQPSWAEAPQWQRDSAMLGVELHTSGDHGPEASHASWMAQKVAEGWMYGPEKNPDLKRHHCIVPFADLPVAQQAKDFIFRGVVHALRDPPLLTQELINSVISDEPETMLSNCRVPMSFEPKLRSAQAGKDVGYADSPKSSGVLAPAPSPVAAQIEVLASQLTGMVCLLGELIDKVRPVLSGDPRNQLESACPDETASCEMEGELIVLSGKLSRCNDLLNTTIRHIQL